MVTVYLNKRYLGDERVIRSIRQYATVFMKGEELRFIAHRYVNDYDVLVDFKSLDGDIRCVSLFIEEIEKILEKAFFKSPSSLRRDRPILKLKKKVEDKHA